MPIESTAIFLNLLRCEATDYYLTFNGHQPSQASVEFNIFFIFAAD